MGASQAAHSSAESQSSTLAELFLRIYTANNNTNTNHIGC